MGLMVGLRRANFVAKAPTEELAPLMMRGTLASFPCSSVRSKGSGIRRFLYKPTAAVKAVLTRGQHIYDWWIGNIEEQLTSQRNRCRLLKAHRGWNVENCVCWAHSVFCISASRSVHFMKSSYTVTFTEILHFCTDGFDDTTNIVPLI